MAEILVQEAPIWGVRLARRQDQISPAGKAPDAYKGLLRAHKAEILDLLEAQDAGLPPDMAPWLHIARQILAGEFNNADGSTRESLTIGLRSIAHPVCQAALKRLSE